MKAGTVSEREFLSVSSYVFLAFQEKNHKQTRKKKKKSLKNPIKVYLRFLEGGLNLAQLWQQDYCAGVVLSTNLPPAPSFPALHYSTKANLRALSAPPPPLDTNLRALSAPPSDILAKSRIEAVNHKAQKHEFFQSLKQMHPICTHPL